MLSHTKQHLIYCKRSAEARRRDLMKWSTSFIVDGIDRRVVIQENLHTGGALRVVRIIDAVVQRSKTATVLVVR